MRIGAFKVSATQQNHPKQKHHVPPTCPSLRHLPPLAMTVSERAKVASASWEVHWARAVLLKQQGLFLIHGCSIPQLEYLHHLTSMCMIPAKRLRFCIDYILYWHYMTPLKAPLAQVQATFHAQWTYECHENSRCVGVKNPPVAVARLYCWSTIPLHS